jgi:cyclin H
MNAPVTMAEILTAELVLLAGINFDLMCFHPYKAVLAFTEDLRTFLKTAKGRTLASFIGEDRAVIGQDLKEMHDGARSIIDDVLVSDVPLMYSPGQIGMAALMVANEQVLGGVSINLLGYVQHRFDQDRFEIQSKLPDICNVLKGLKDGLYGCGNHNVDLVALKAVHKKLKKCRGWGLSEKKNKKKRKGEGDGDGETEEPKEKRIKTEE